MGQLLVDGRRVAPMTGEVLGVVAQNGPRPAADGASTGFHGGTGMPMTS